MIFKEMNIMNDYSFGEKIYRLRKDMKLSQSELGAKVGVTNKSVSKWETGSAKPGVDTIKALAGIFGVSVDYLLSDPVESKNITKIVLTGGPCAGKTTALSKIQQEFSNKGYHVVIVPETASELINNGISPQMMEKNSDFQKILIKLQIEKENIWQSAVQKISGAEKILIVHDRGIMDSKAYMTEAEFNEALISLGMNQTEIRDRYDAVFHLVTAAKGADEFYSNENNPARTETAEQAIALDDLTVSVWTGHPHLRVIDNSGDFENKKFRLISEIASFLGEPEPCEIERKYLIKYPDIKLLENNPKCHRVEIIQTYLKSENGCELRVRQRGENGSYTYFRTEKRTVSDIKRIEIESRLSKDEYLALLMEADTAKKQIRKTRYCLMHENQYFEIDVYPFWNDRAIMEIELSNADDNIVFPEYIDIIKEVTSDPSYKNAALASL
jgi:transcriptional regulator with XRE-family HTH domain/CYTH domain-containing protein